MAANSGRAQLAVFVMIITPLLFSTNPVFGRSVVGDVSPFMLAFLRWLLVAVALLPFMIADAAALKNLMRGHKRLIVMIAFFGMWINGGMVYFGLARTSAINATLILTTSPVMILLIEATFFGRRISLREGLGTVIAFLGVATIVLRGNPAGILTLDFNTGDLFILLGAFSWAIYTVLSRAEALRSVSTIALLGLMAAVGSVLLSPIALMEFAAGAPMPVTREAWIGIAGIVVFASLLAFTAYQFGVRHLGPSLAALFMYLMPPYGVLLAVLLLGEQFHAFHAAGIALVMTGIVLATFPVTWMRERLRRGR